MEETMVRHGHYVIEGYHVKRRGSTPGIHWIIQDARGIKELARVNTLPEARSRIASWVSASRYV